MKKILFIGNSPLPNENVKSRPAAGLRTHQFLKPLLSLSGKFNLKVVTIAMPECYEDSAKVSSAALSKNFDPHVQASTLRSKFSCHLASGTFAESSYGELTEQGESLGTGTGAETGTGVGVGVGAGAKIRTGVDGFENGKSSPGLAQSAQINISKDDPDLIQKIQKIYDEFEPEVVISINTYPSYVASKIKFNAPLWCDLNGWIMAEAQAQSYKLDSNSFIAHYYEMEKSILNRGDKFSSVSLNQKFAILGELAFLGRLNKESFGYEFVHHIPNATEEFENEFASPVCGARSRYEKESRRNGTENLLKGTSCLVGSPSGRLNEKFDKEKYKGILEKYFKDIPEDAFVLLWVGGYNTWVDEITLFKGVEDAMEKCSKLYFVSTGGEISRLDDKTFKNFKSRIDASKFKDRFIFLGWVPTNDIPYIYIRGDVGLNVDRKCVETFTGARNRINEMMKFGLPVITTLGSEISYEVEKYECGLGVLSGKHEFLTEKICYIYKEWGGGSHKFKQLAINGKNYIDKHNYEKIIESLLTWLENPRPAPDRNVNLEFGIGGKFWGAIKYLKMNGFKKFFKKLWQKI